MKAKINIYVVAFGVVIALVIAAAASTLVFNKSLSSTNVSLSNLPNYGPAPNIQGVSAWINSPPLNLSQLRGKVVLVDFWTYSCINCIRSIPHLNAWYNAYGNNGLVIIGVHTPEFQFEHNYSNVYAAVQKFGIKYPVALDNNYSTWDAYGNEYWPADYLIDADGDMRYVVFGEGNYNQTEAVIRELLESAGYQVQSNFTDVPLGVNFSQIGSSEMYLGYSEAKGHGDSLATGEGYFPGQTHNYSFTNITQENAIYLSGEWHNAPDGMVAVNDSKIFLVYEADKLNIVAGASGVNSSPITVRLDGSNITAQYLGSDLHLVNGVGVANITSPRLYNLVSAPSYEWRIIEIDASPGFKIYTFTFG